MMAISRLSLWTVLVVVASMSTTGWPQDANAPRAIGSVTGYVYCADTDKPARLARVTMEPVEDFDAIKTDAEGRIERTRAPSNIVVQTKSDGSYFIDPVPVGAYYILVELPGYLSPLTEFSSDDLNWPDEDAAKRFRAELKAISVANGQTTRVDVRLERGAVITGKVSYDDGSPTINAYIELFQIEKDGTRKPVSDLAQSRFSGAARTDDRGRYRISTLRPGEYLIAVNVQRMYGMMMTTGEVLSRYDRGMLNATNSSLFFYGGGTKISKAKQIKVRGDDERTDIDITIPLSRLYSVSGIVIATSDGHAVNRAHVTLRDKPDGTTIKDVYVYMDGAGRFTMENIPDGIYLLKIVDANDGVTETGTSEGGRVSYSRWVAKHRFADTQIIVDVHKDVSDITVKVDDQPESKAESNKTDQ